jgi:hypothetical protein
MELSTTQEDQLLGHSIVFQHFMEPEGSIPNSQALFTCSYPEPDQYTTHAKIHVRTVTCSVLLVGTVMELSTTREAPNC